MRISVVEEFAEPVAVRFEAGRVLDPVLQALTVSAGGDGLGRGIKSAATRGSSRKSTMG
jgi:hypothetical protein